MPGSPLLNIGTALGGLTSGYNQSQNQAIQQALARLQLQQAQGAQNSQGLAALALQAGLLGNNAPNPLQSLPTPTASSMPGPTPVVAPQINVPQNPAPQPPPPGVPVGTTNPPVPSDVPAQPADAGVFDYNDAIAAGRAEAADAKAQQPQTPTPAPAPGPQTAAAGTSDTSDTSSAPQAGGGWGMQLPNGQTIDMSTMFKTVDYGKLAQGIAKLAPPGTSQADIFNAVLDLGKLADGDKVQQQQAGLLARAIFGGQVKLAAIGEQQQGAMARTQVQQAGATGRTQLQQAGAGQRTAAQQAGAEQRTQEQIASREKIAAASQDLRERSMNIRNANQQRALDLRQQAVETALRNANRGDMAAQVTAIRARISTIKPDAAGNYSDQQQAQLKAFNDQIAAIAANASAAGP